jgi:N-acyl-D-aspartate/D-glutamate deacylase
MLDMLIKGGTVIDGTGAAGEVADVAVANGEVAAVGRLGETSSRRVIDAAGKVVCPGFIDIHTHNDLYVIRDDFETLFEPYLRQGITTCVANNCGWSPAPWPSAYPELMHATLRSMGVSKEFRQSWESQAEFHTYLKTRGLPMNFVPLAAHGPIRIAAMGDSARFSTPQELEVMKSEVRSAMEAGCRGFSTGLTYFPGMYAHTDEIKELAKVCAEYGGTYATHVRGLSSTFDRAVGEAIDIARASGCPLQVSHLMSVPKLYGLEHIVNFGVDVFESVNKVVPLPGWPNRALKKAVKNIDRALDEGLDVGMDFIPYVLGNTTVTQLFPPWANIGGTDALVKRLADPDTRERIKRDISKLTQKWPHWEEGSWSDNYVKSLGWKLFRILSVGSEENRHMEGRLVTELAKEAGKDPFDFLADLTVEEEGMVLFLMGLSPGPWVEKVFMSVQQHPRLSVGADSLFPEKGAPPLSAYGCFVRILDHYVKDLGFYTLENAIHRCTGMAASRYNLSDRGVIRPGSAADIVVFDYENVRDNSSWEDPARYPDGIEQVIVNGTMVVSEGKYDAEAHAGKLL